MTQSDLYRRAQEASELANIASTAALISKTVPAHVYAAEMHRNAADLWEHLKIHSLQDITLYQEAKATTYNHCEKSYDHAVKANLE